MKTWQWLGYLGLIPFFICLWLSASSSNKLSVNPEQAFIFYSAIILSFLSGVLWRKDTLAQNSKSQILSNILCLYAYLCLLLPIYYALVFLPFGYVGLLFTEYLLCNNKEYAYTKPYFTMRLILTLLVIILHGLALISWF